MEWMIGPNARVLGLWLIAAMGCTAGACAGDRADGANHVSDSLPVDAGVEVIGAGVISTPSRNEVFPAEDPVTGDLWFSAYDDDFNGQTVMVSRRAPSGWSEPEVAPFSGHWGDRAPRFSPDGQALYFTSNRPGTLGEDADDQNIWRVDRTANGWSEPTLLPAPVNSSWNDMHVVVTERTFWIPSRRDGGFGNSDIYRLARSGGPVIERLPAPVNDSLSQPDLWVSQDDTWMILVITDHPDGFGGDDLFVSRWDGTRWSASRNLGPIVNSDQYEYGPSVSQDGRYLFFNSLRGGTEDIYRIALSALPALDH